MDKLLELNSKSSSIQWSEVLEHFNENYSVNFNYCDTFGAQLKIQSTQNISQTLLSQLKSFLKSRGQQPQYMCSQKTLDLIDSSVVSSNDEVKEKWEVRALTTLRLVMRERNGVEFLNSREYLEVYLMIVSIHVELDDDTLQISKLWNAALSCINNSIVFNSKAQCDLFESGSFPAFLELLKKPLYAKTASLILRIIYTLGANYNDIARHLKNTLKPLELIVKILANTTRDITNHPLPIGGHRSELLIETLKIIFLLASVDSDSPMEIDEIQTEIEGDDGNNASASTTRTESPALKTENQTILTQLGILLVELLLKLPLGIPGVIEIKLQVINVLIYMPAEYSHYIYINGAIEPIMDLLDHQMKLLSIDGTSATSGSTLTPIVIVCNLIAGSSPKALYCVKDYIFPPSKEDKLREKRLADKEELEKVMNDPNSTDESIIRAKKHQHSASMTPEDPEPDSLRFFLFEQMTSVESTSKRYISELLYTLCHGNANEFIRRCGLGNGFHLLQLKGLFGSPTDDGASGIKSL